MSELRRGWPLLHKLATIAHYVALPAAMVASLVYSRPDYDKPNKSLAPSN